MKFLLNLKSWTNKTSNRSSHIFSIIDCARINFKSMLNIIEIDIWDVAKSGLFCICLIVIAILLFKWMWLDHLVFDLPRGSYRINNDFKESMKVGTFSDYVRVMWVILYDLDIPYWLDFVGLEGRLCSLGYSFIYFVRSMMSEMFIFFCFWSMFTLGIYLFIAFYAGSRL